MQEIPFGKFGFIKKESFEWMRGHLPLLGGALAIIVVGVMVVFQGFKKEPEADFLIAEMAFRRWEKTSLAQLQTLLKKHPELHTKYDGPIARKLLASSEAGLAASFGKAALKRVKDLSPYHTHFSETSLLIGEGQLTEALAKAKELKNLIDSDTAFPGQKYGSILFAFNLLRIAMLEKTVGTKEGEKSAWQELKKHAGWSEEPFITKYDPEAFRLLAENFRSKEISLADYIRHREKFLISK
jgi:hypothetical protein